MLDKISSAEAYMSVYKGPHGIFTEWSLVGLVEIQ